MRRLPLLLIISLGVAGSLSCRKQHMSVNGHEVGATVDKLQRKGTGTPINLPDALTAIRTFVQTRGVIELSIKGGEVVPGAAMRLLNATTGSELVNTAAKSTSLRSTDDPFGLDLTLADNSYDFALRLYPLDPAFNGKFAYGSNDLHLLVDESTKALSASRTVHLADFTFVFLGFSAFDSQTQQQGGFQAQVEYTAGPIATNGTYQMTLGALALPNW
ncbi:MAG: hypothetical protein NTZ90_07970 [Proteobacteria bacterium]|nr:hypothetical protein [Pseudomonadota bacterium]